MVDIKTILVTTDFSETSRVAFRTARALADKYEAKIVLAHIRENLPQMFVAEYAHASFSELQEREEEASRERLAEWGSELGGGVEIAMATGTPHLEIVRLAEEHAADVIVIATHGRGFFSHAFLGSTTERVLRRAPCAVLVVRGRETEESSGEA
jgi:universal stress protein A